MPQSSLLNKRTPAAARESRFTVGLAPGVAQQVKVYADATDSSMSRAIAALVQIGLEGHEQRKREFFKKLKANLANDNAAAEDQLIDEFRELILGR